jgi:hypothetical protein
MKNIIFYNIYLLILSCSVVWANEDDIYMRKVKDDNGDEIIEISSTKKPGATAILPNRKSGKSSGGESSSKSSRSSSSNAGKKSENIGPRSLPDRALKFKDFVDAAAKYYDLPTALLWAVMSVESNFYPHVVSNKGAQGLMQLLPGTAGDMGVNDPFDPEQNIYGGARFLRILVNRFKGDLVLTLSAYFAGGQGMQNAHDRNRSSLDGEMFSKQVFEYVRKTISAYYAYRPSTDGEISVQ